jgi:hypothetical protein
LPFVGLHQGGGARVVYVSLADEGGAATCHVEELVLQVRQSPLMGADER